MLSLFSSPSLPEIPQPIFPFGRVASRVEALSRTAAFPRFGPSRPSVLLNEQSSKSEKAYGAKVLTSQEKKALFLRTGPVSPFRGLPPPLERSLAVTLPAPAAAIIISPRFPLAASPSRHLTPSKRSSLHSLVSPSPTLLLVRLAYLRRRRSANNLIQED